MEGLTTFINVRTDFGFKRLFGTPKNKHILIRFLNALLGNEITVTDVVYHDKEILPSSEKGKRIIYDVYCTSVNEGRHHFILEMQNFFEPPFADRVLYYTAKAISGQGKRGWNYDLSPVITIVFTDFDFGKMKKALVHEMQVADLTTHDVLTEKMRIFLLSLKQMESKDWSDCKNETERLMYLIKNMEKLDKNSEIYKGKEYQDIFDAAETDNMVQEEAVAYSQSLQKLEDIRTTIIYNREEGRAEGRAETMRENARRMLENGFNPDIIQKITGLSIEEISQL